MSSRKPPSRRNSEYTDRHQARQLQSMSPGAMGGRLFSAQPVVPTFAGASFDIVSGGPGDAQIAFARDRFTLSAATPTLSLTYVPVAASQHLYLNGLQQNEGVDYTLSGLTVTVLAAMGALSGDVLEVRYAYLPDLATVPTPPPTEAPTGVTVLFRLDETSGTTAIDSSGNSHDGTWTGTPTFGAASLLAAGTGTSVTFSGDDYVEIAHDTWMDTTTFSVEAFIKTTATTAPVWDRDVYGAIGNRDRLWASRVSSAGKFEVYTFDGTGVVAATAVSTTTVNNGAKHHVAATLDGTNLKVYVDGTLEATVAAGPIVYATSGVGTYLGLGVNRSGGTGSVAATFVGQIDEAAYYAGTVLSAADIATRAAQ